MKKLLTIFLVSAVALTAHYTYRLHVFALKASQGFEYTYAAIDCLIQENGQTQSDADILFKGFKSRKAYADAVNKEFPGVYDKDSTLLNRKMYNDQIPECHVFYSRYRCWMLDVKDPKSLDGCGKHFGFNQEEIDTMKKDPSSYDRLIHAMWARHEGEKK